MNAKENRMRDIAMNGITEATHLLTRSKNDATYNDIVRAARAAQAAAEDLNRLSGYMLHRTEAEKIEEESGPADSQFRRS